jgi:hypothetical protein
MKTMIAYCGLKCETCPIHLATLEKNSSHQQKMRESIAEECSNLYNMNLDAEEITDCDGCRTDSGRLFAGCSKCEIRKCAIYKKLENCAFCDDYICEILKKHFELDPDSEARLNKIKHSIKI